jgi:hypothetical protein
MIKTSNTQKLKQISYKSSEVKVKVKVKVQVKAKVKVKQSRYRPGVAQRVPGS